MTVAEGALTCGGGLGGARTSEWRTPKEACCMEIHGQDDGAVIVGAAEMQVLGASAVVAGEL